MIVYIPRDDFRGALLASLLDITPAGWSIGLRPLQY
jgi:hypothetical protein